MPKPIDHDIKVIAVCMSTITCLFVLLIFWFPKIYYYCINNIVFRGFICCIALPSFLYMAYMSFGLLSSHNLEQYSPLYGNSNNPLYRDGMSYTSYDNNEKFSHLYGRHDSPLYRDSTSSVQSNYEYSNL